MDGDGRGVLDAERSWADAAVDGGRYRVDGKKSLKILFWIIGLSHA